MAVFSYTGIVCVFLIICYCNEVFGRSGESSVRKCKRISPFYGGEVTYTHDTEGRSNAFYSCEDAYSLFPSDIDYSNCTKHRKWKPKPPKCLRKAKVGKPDHGKVCKGRSDILLHSESYEICCDSGYELYSNKYLEKTRARIKNNNGSLEPRIPECVEARCDPSAQYMAKVRYMNGSNIMTKFPSRTDILLSCKDGYDFYRGDRHMTTPLKRTCEKGNIQNAPKCKESRCLFSGYPSNKDTYQRVYLGDAQLVFDDQYIEPRQKIEVFCHKKKQYELYVNSTETHLEEFISKCKYGQFEHKKEKFPICVERRCSFSVSSEVCFWTDDREHCKAYNFTIPSRSSVHMRCRDGYKLSRSEDGRSVEVDEDALIMCNKGAYAESYRCISEPCAVPTVKHAKLISKEASSYEHGENITFLCNNGFHFNESSLNEEDRFETTCQLGKWINIIPSECQPDLCSLSLYTGISFWANSRLLTEENGLIQTFENGTKLQIECKDGYAMKDIKSGQRFASRRKYATCSFGNWTHQYSCYSEQCSVPKVNNAHLLHTDARIYEHSKKISFVCDTGFHFYQNISTKVNAFETTCSLGQWTDNIPSECIPDGCKLALLEGTKYFSADKTVEISKATLMEHTTPIRMQCREMFDLFDENNTIFLDKDYMPAVTCYQGKWTNQHFCKKRCGTFNITNGKLIKDGRNVTEGETIAHGESEYVKYNNKKADSDLPADSSMECHDRKWHNFVGVNSSSSTPAKTTEIITTVAIDSTTISEADKRRSKDVLPDKNQIQNTRNKGCTLPDDPRYTYTDSDDNNKDPSSFISDGTTLTVACTTLDLYEYYTNYDYDYDNNSTSTVTCMNNTLSDFDLDCPEVTLNTCKELQHGSVNEKNGYFIVSCDEGYSLDLIVPERPQCTCENGHLKSVFGGQTPACIPDKCVVPYVFDVRLSVTDRKRVSLSGGSVVEVGDFVYFNCSKVGESKYEPLNRRFTCVNGLWVEAEKDRNWKLGFDGEFPDCRAAVCEPNCTNGGVCFKDDNCRCKHLTEGKRCEKFICDDTCFENGGKCVGPGRCSCPADRAGLNCEQIQPKKCDYTFDAGRKWFPKWNEIAETRTHYSGKKESAKYCKEDCLKQQKIDLKSVFYSLGHKECFCFAVSEKSFFVPKKDVPEKGEWKSYVYILSCK